MSSIRRRSSSISSVNKHTNKQGSILSSASNTGKNVNDKKKAFSRPTWDSTTNDLNQLKSTSEDIERRRISHQSKNIDAARNEVQRKLKGQLSKSNLKNDPQAQLALLKEILFDDDNYIKDRAYRTENTLKAVQNFFNDQDDDNDSIITNGRRQAKINMTLAPNVKDLNESNLPLPPEMMKKNIKSNQKLSNIKINNINDLDDSSNDDIPVQDENKSNSIIEDKLKKFKNSNDLEKYKQLLELKEKLLESTLLKNSSNKDKYKKTSQLSQLDTTELNINDLEECLRILASNNKKEENDYENSINFNNSNKNHTSINTFKMFENALNELENKLIDFEKNMGKESSNYLSSKQNNSSNSSNSTTTYTLTLIKIISHLIDHVKDTAVELNFEKLRSVELNKQLEIHRKLIDGLTNEVLGVKDQNKKLLNGFINQQAKLEAEMEQIKMFMRNMANPLPNQYPIINTSIQPHRLSTFSTHSQSSLDLNDINFVNQQQHQQQQRNSAFQHHIIQQNTQSISQQQQQQQQLPRPVSCMSSLNTINTLEPKTGDKFAERLNAMLFNENQTLNQPANFRNSFDSFRSLSNLTSNNKQIMNDFNSQIQELSFKNVEAQQKLKQLQLEQKQLSLSNNEIQQIKLNNENDQKQREALDKLKKEQRLLKEQIDMLNRERECAQSELDALVSTGPSSKPNDNNKNIQSAVIKHLNEINMNEIHHNYELLSTNTPSLSPIRPEKNV